MAMPFEEIEPAYLVPERDFTTRELAGGSKLYYARNPLNDLFEFSIAIDIGSLSRKAPARGPRTTRQVGHPALHLRSAEKGVVQARHRFLG